MHSLRPTSGLLLVGHGTRHEEGQAEFRTIASKVAAALAPQPVEAGYIELNEPTIDEAFLRLVEHGAGHVRVAPLLLFAAGHARTDIPEAVSRATAMHPHVTVEFASPFGLDDRILALSQRRYREALAGRMPVLAEDTYWLLVGRGSSDPTASGELSKFAMERARRSSLPLFGHCFVAAARPTVPEGLFAAASLPVKRIVVQPHLLFRGAVLDEVTAAVARFESERPDIDWVTTAHLGPEQEVVDAVIACATR
jgi:sirohydrochlorin cobaltochelatase